MRHLILVGAAAAAALTMGACHKTGSNAGKDLAHPADSAPVNAAQDAAGGAVGVVSGVTASSSASAYVPAAAIADMYEVAAGKIAETRAKSPEVQAFARMMVKDHTKSTEALKTALKTAGLAVTPPAEMDERRKGMLQNLQAAGDSDFDLAYLHQQLAAHVEALELHKGYADHGDNPTLKDVAAKITPVVEQHLGEIKRIGGDKLKDALSSSSGGH